MQTQGRILAIDAGNTRIKWGLHEGRGWRAQGAVERDEVATLAQSLASLPAPARIVVSSVAGEQVRSLLSALLARWSAPVQWIASASAQCGVVSRYDPAQLGCDRWAALIAARHLASGPVLVVMSGTATTVDALTGEGEFLGGLILPGVDLMVESLSARTAGIRLEAGEFQPFPTATRNAVFSGALQATAGAIERMFAALRAADGNEPQCVLGGGAAQRLRPLLALPLREADNLVLEGLVRIARE